MSSRKLSILEINGESVFASTPVMDYIDELQARLRDESTYAGLTRDALKRLADAVDDIATDDNLMRPTQRVAQLRGVATDARAALAKTTSPEIVRCEHKWATDGLGPTQCVRCGEISGTTRSPAVGTGWLSQPEERDRLGEGLSPAAQQAGVRELENPYWEGTKFARVCAIYKAMSAANGLLSQDSAPAGVSLDAMRWRKLCGLMAYGDFMIVQVPDGDAENVEFDYIHELEAAVDAASWKVAECGRQSDERLLEKRRTAQVRVEEPKA